jgi:hypothetical protein
MDCKNEADKKKDVETKCLLSYINSGSKIATYILYVKEKSSEGFGDKKSCENNFNSCEEKSGK